MEIEVKYQLPSSEVLEAVWNDKKLMEITIPDSIEKVPMLAIYYDTKDRALNRAGMVMRVRREGDDAFCTIKWNGKLVGGVYEREEINIPLQTKDAYCVPKAEVLEHYEKGREIVTLTQDSSLVPTLKMEFLRCRKKLNYGKNIIELALDQGEIIAGEKTCDILEMELEHQSGTDPLIVLELGEVVAYDYGLELQTRSKYARGLELLNMRDGSR